MNWKTRWGVFRSAVIYYWKPFNRRRLQQFYRNLVKPGQLCFDVGAHLGNRTQAFLDLGAQVIAVEPQPACVHYLQKRFASNGAVTIVPKAIGASPGSAQLHINQRNPTISTLADADWRKKMNAAASTEQHWEQTISVEVITLQQLIDRYGIPHFCKVDVEGFELAALKGLQVPIPCLSFEFVSIEWEVIFPCLDQLEALGIYQYNWSKGESQQMAYDQWVTVEQLKEDFKQKPEKVMSGDIYARLLK